MKDTDFEFEGMDWNNVGYFGRPRPPGGARFPASPTKSPWYAWAVACEQATRGDFSSIPRLLDIADKEIDGVLDRLCARLIGDAGPASCFPPLIDLIVADDNYEFTYSACGAVATRGRLGDIPVILDAYEANALDQDAEILPIHIFCMLDPGDYSTPTAAADFSSFAGYRAAIERLTGDLAERLGTLDALVWRGDLFSAQRLARVVIDAARSPQFPSDIARRFEATTGIDYSQWYKDGRFQPLIAASAAEDFLESPAAGRFDAGVRYFFGHRVPD